MLVKFIILISVCTGLYYCAMNISITDNSVLTVDSRIERDTK